MGGSSSISYAKAVSEPREGESAVYRNPNCVDKLLQVCNQDCTTMKDVFLQVEQRYANNNAMGRIVTKDKTSQIEYTTYKDLLKSARNIGSAIRKEKLYNQPEGQPYCFVGIFSKNRPQWTIVDVACILYNMTTIPIYDTLGDQNITYVFKHTGLRVCFVSGGSLKALMKTADLDQVNTLVCFDPFTEEQILYFKERNVSLVSFQDLVKKGQQNPLSEKEFKTTPKDCLTFSYTSGTTGPPKGAMISHRNIVSFLGALELNEDTKITEKDIALSYLPLPHILEREFLFSIFTCGATVVYYSGDVQKLKDDLSLVKPTLFVSVPRLYSRFHDVLKAKFKDVTGYQKTLLDYGLQTKLNNLDKNGSYTHKIYDNILFHKTKEVLGGRVRIMVSGSAPILPDVQKFMKVVMACPLIEGYGQTESTGGTFVSYGRDKNVRHVGGPAANVEFKLVDIPEMNYLHTDKDEQGRPTPRGEVWMRGPAVFLGYYRAEDKTKETLTEDGWLKSGDVGCISAQSKALSLIDRKKNIFKLQQGQYVAAEKVQNCYMKCPQIAQVYLHGESTESFAIAIITPNKKFVEEFAQQHKIEGTYDQLCKKKEVIAEILDRVTKIGKEGGLASFEQAKNIYLEPEGFLQRGILTNTMKIQRHEAKKAYSKQIEAMYAQGMFKK